MKAAKLKRMYRARVLTPHLEPEIVTVDCTAVTGTHITYMSGAGKETRDAIRSDNVAYFESTVEARQFIVKYAERKAADFQGIADAWRGCAERFNNQSK